MPEAPTRKQAISRFLLVALWLPLVAFVAMAAVQFYLLPRMPEPAATHWGFAGEPDGFGAAWTYPAMLLGVGAGVVVVFAVTALLGAAKAEGGMDLRFMSAVNLWYTGFMGVFLTWLFVIQLDAADASTAVLSWEIPVVALVVGLVLGLIGWKVTPKVKGAAVDGAHPEPVALSPGEQATWLRTVRMSGPMFALLGGAALLTLVMTVFIATSEEDPVATWIMVAVTLLLVTIIPFLSVFRARINGAGFSVKSAGGWPKFVIPTSEIESVEVVHVNPLGEFGGWGWRLSPTHGQGIVMRTGEGLRITRTDGRKFTLTIDDAATAAALLQGIKDRNDE